MSVPNEYQKKLEAEAKKWGEHLKVEADVDLLGDSWLDQPMVAEHYNHRGLIDSLTWPEWIKQRLGGPACRSLEMGCGTGSRSVRLFESGASACIEGIDISEERLSELNGRLSSRAIPGRFWVADANTIELPTSTYDLIFSCHSFHHFVELETIMERVHRALTPGGVFVLEEFVGPTQFQWTDLQIDLVKSVLAFVPQELRTFRWGAIKQLEGGQRPRKLWQYPPLSRFDRGRSSRCLTGISIWFTRERSGALFNIFCTTASFTISIEIMAFQKNM